MVRITLDSALSITYERFMSIGWINEPTSDTILWLIDGTVKPGQFIPEEVKSNYFPNEGPNKIRTIEFLP